MSRERAREARARVVGGGLALGLLGALAPAQEQVPARSRLTEVFGDVAREHLEQPLAVERLGEALVPGRLARLLEDLDLELRAFEDGDGGELGLGLTYSMAKTLVEPDSELSGSLDFVAWGNVAFDPESNPDDFLSTSLRLRWLGTRTFGPETETRLARARSLPNPEGETLAAFDPERFTALSLRFAREPSAAAIRADADFQALARAYLRDVERNLPPELVWDFDLHAAYESDQEFSTRQIVLGATLGGRLVSWNPDSDLSRFNLFDYPAAALRWLAGEDFRASGQAWPTLVGGLDVVDASSDDVRGSLTEDASFLRARLEAGLKSRALELGGEVLYLSAGWRYDHELDPTASVSRAGVDEHSHLRVRMDLPRGWSLTYATGKLPLDDEEDSTFALGFALSL